MEVPTLNFYEAVMFAHFDIVAPSAATVPYRWRISYTGVPVAPLPGRAEMESNISARRRQMPAWKRVLPRYATDSPYWPALFKKERKLPNREGREGFWSIPRRTKHTVIAAARLEEVLRLANNVGIVEVMFDDEEEAGGSEEVKLLTSG